MKQIDTILLVKDIEISHSFYSDIFALELLHDWNVMKIYKNRLSLHQIDKIQPKEFIKEQNISSEPNKSIIIYIELDRDQNLEDFLNYLKAKDVNILHGIYKLPWQRIIRISDPDGYIIEVGEPPK